MQTKIRQKNIPFKIQRKNVTEKVDKKRLDFYKGVKPPVPKFFMKILTTAFGMDVESNFVYLKRRELLKVGALSLALSFLPIKETLKAMEAGTNDTKDKIENVLSSTDPIDYEKLTPVQKKMYDHFIKDKKWTYEKMDALKGKELGAELLTFLTKKEAGEGYRFYTRLKGEKHTQETVDETKRLLGSTE